jgi:alanine-glyoxylate transaminase/serine-glyoxylate transaminase/serine-pyruvate transaminase
MEVVMEIGDFRPADRLLLGPGPANVHPRVLRALGTPVLGHLDPQFLSTLAEVTDLLRAAYRTCNEWTFAVSGTGSAGMEAVASSLTEPGDRVLVCVAGYFGDRMREVFRRCGAEVATVESPWGKPVDPEDAARVIQEVRPRIVGVVHAETSTGVLQPLEEIRDIARAYGALLVVDAVTSFGGVPLEVDRAGLDSVFACTQKCLGAPPGMSPVTLSEAAVRKIQGRRRPVQSYYFDLGLLWGYWSGNGYHHTMSATMIYALREALRILLEEGLEARWARHERVGRALQAGLQAMGLELFAAEGYRLPVLTTVRVPEGVDGERVRRRLLEEFDIEIGAGFGSFRNHIWRIGTMGYNAQPRIVLLLLSSLEAVLREEGFRVPPGAGVEAALELLGER